MPRGFLAVNISILLFLIFYIINILFYLYSIHMFTFGLMLLNKLKKTSSTMKRKKAKMKKVVDVRFNETRPATTMNMVIPRLGTTTASSM